MNLESDGDSVYESSFAGHNRLYESLYENTNKKREHIFINPISLKFINSNKKWQKTDIEKNYEIENVV